MTALLVLGGADGALSAIRTARALGLWTVCVDGRTDAPAAAIADELLNVSTRDVDGIVAELGDRRDIGGVVSPASDVNLPSQHALAERLGLPHGLSAAAVRSSVDKGHFREISDRLGHPGPRYLQGSPAEVLAGAAAVGDRLMVKPTDSSGSRGISRVDPGDDLTAAIGSAVAYSASGVVIVEEYLDATHHTVEAIVTGGRVALLGISERRLTPPPYFVTLEHRMSTGSSPLLDRVKEMLDEACAALDYRWGALNVDVMVTDDGRVVLGEWGARLGGNGMGELLYLSSGVDATEAYVRMALGETVDVAARHTRHSAFRALGATSTGKLTAIVGLDRARALPGVADIVVAVSPGEHVEPYTRAGAKLGYSLTYGVDQAAAVDALDRVEDALSFTVEPATP